MSDGAITGRSLSSLAMIAGLVIASLLAAADLITGRQVDLIFLGVVALGLSAILRPWTGSRALAALGGLAAAVTLASLQLWQSSLRYMPYLVIWPANLAMAYIFGRGLLPGRLPVLLELVRAVGKGPVDEPRFHRFIYWQCAWWCAFTLATAFFAAVAMFSEAIRVWATPWLTMVIILQVVWFVLSHYYAALRYGRTEKWWNTLQLIARPGIWSKLRA